MKLFRDCMLAIFGTPRLRLTSTNLSKLSRVVPVRSSNPVFHSESKRMTDEFAIPVLGSETGREVDDPLRYSIDSRFSSNNSQDDKKRIVENKEEEKDLNMARLEQAHYAKIQDPWMLRPPSDSIMMKKLLDEDQFFSSSVIHLESLKNFYDVSMYEFIVAPKPSLPFTVESFPVYLFKECRDLMLMQSMLEFCKYNPMILFQIEGSLRDHSEESVSLRDFYMLPFLLRVQQIDPDISDLSKLTLQLMGFPNLLSMKLFYDVSTDERIWKLIDSFDWGFMDEFEAENLSYSSEIYGYTNDLFK